MPKALDTVSGFVTAPGSTLTNWTLASGDSLAVRNADMTKKTMLLTAWFFNQVAGTAVIRSPRLHDNVQGIRSTVLAADVEEFFPDGVAQRLYPQDTLVVQQSGSAVGGQIESGSLLIYYEDVPGESARLIDVAELQKRIQNVMTVENPITPGAAGGYSGGVAINASFDLLKANTDYALLGYLVSARACTVAWRGADSGNLRVSGPAEPGKRDRTSNWFVGLSSSFGMPLIPVFNAANKSNITVDVVQNQAATALTVTSIFAELSA
jgi:hypothetical protein